MSDKKRLRIGVIGCGGVAQMMHLPYLQSLPEIYEIYALSDLSKGVLKFLGDRYQVPEDRRFLNYRDLIATDVDAVFVLNGGDHTPQILDALQAKKHVFVEKPMCYTLEQADKIIQAVEEANVKLMVGYMKRYDPGYIYAQKTINETDDIQYVQINTLHPSEDDYISVHEIVRFDDVPADVIDTIRAVEKHEIIKAVGDVSPTLRNLYAGLFLGSMVHDANALRGLLGEPEDVLFTELWPPDEADVSVTTVMRYPNNVRVVYTWSYLDELRDYFQEIAVMASASRIRIQFPSPYLRQFPTPIVVQGMENGAAYTKRVEVSHEEAFKLEIIAFHDDITHDKHPLTDAQDARGDIKLLQQIFAAHSPDGLGGEAVR